MRTIEQLVADAVRLRRERIAIMAQIRLVELEIEEHFPCERTEETLKTVNGSVTRMVINEWWLAPGSLGKVRFILGPRADELINAENPMSPTPALRAMLLSGDDPIGLLLRRYVLIMQTVRYDALDAMSDSAVTPGPEFQVITLPEYERRPG